MASFLRVAGLLMSDKEILFVKETKNHLWKLPGGKVEVGESIKGALKREFKEELNIDIEVGDYLGFAEYPNEDPKLDRKVMVFKVYSKDKITQAQEIFDARLIKASSIRWNFIENATKKFLMDYMDLDDIFDTSIGTVVFKEENKRIKFLLLYKQSNQMWDWPKGHYHEDGKDKSELEVALRELDEETKINDISYIEGFRYEYKFINPKGSHRQIIMFLGKTNQEPKLSKEHSEYKWESFDSACKLMHFKEKIELLSATKEYLTKKGYIV